MKVIKNYSFCCLIIFYIFYPADCQPHLSVKISCRVDIDCKESFSASAQCQGNYCQCLDPSSNTYDFCDGKPPSPLSGNHRFPVCKTDRQCSDTSNEFCNTRISQCQCKQNYLRSENSFKCLPVITTLNEKCLENKQCQTLNNTACLEGECRCKTGFHNVNGSCWQSIELNEKCLKTEECSHIEYAQCNSTGICNCSSIAVPILHQQICRLKVHVGSSCTQSANCTTIGAKCEGNKCACPQNYHEVDYINRCVENKALGQTCANSYECFLGEGLKNLTKCDKQICKCVDHYEQMGTTCQLSATEDIVGVSKPQGLSVIGDRCTHDEDCSIAGSPEGSVKCLQNICNCVEGYIRDGNHCSSADTISKTSAALLVVLFVISKFLN